MSARPPAWPTGPYDVILADPSWAYGFSRSKSRAIQRKYRTMTLDEICALPVRELAAESAALYLWVPAPKLLEVAPAVLEGWGFTYKTGRVWDKGRIGAGYWVRGEHEHLLIAARGAMSPPAPAVRPGSMIREKRGKHSKKPDQARLAIARAHPHVRKIELFARDEDFCGEPTPRFVPLWRDGCWDAWGDELWPQAPAGLGHAAMEART